MNAVIFLGPSLPLERARAILPTAHYLAPARQADLLTAVVNLQPTVIGLVDGVFLQQLSVWHKEILYALERGVHVFGASSMGALRAAETDSFGMVGVGKIYEQFASGELTDDDEVALVHASASDGYQKMSEPMVNLRATFAAAHAAQVISAAELALLVDIAKQLHFADRTFGKIFDLAVERGAGAATMAAMRAFVKAGYVDLKANDAVQLLVTIRDLASDIDPPFVRHRTALNTGFETMYNRDREVVTESGPVSLDRAAEYVSLHHTGFHDLSFNALNRALATVLARLVDVDVTPGDVSIEAERFRYRHRLADDSAFRGWLEANHLAETEFDQLMREAALCRALHRWLIYARFTERTTRLVLDQLKWENEYEPWVARAARQQRVLDRSNPLELGAEIEAPTGSLLDAHERYEGVIFDAQPAIWAEDAGFNSESDLRDGLLRAALARDTLLSVLTTDHIA